MLSNALPLFIMLLNIHFLQINFIFLSSTFSFLTFHFLINIPFITQHSSPNLRLYLLFLPLFLSHTYIPSLTLYLSHSLYPLWKWQAQNNLWRRELFSVTYGGASICYVLFPKESTLAMSGSMEKRREYRGKE